MAGVESRSCAANNECATIDDMREFELKTFGQEYQTSSANWAAHCLKQNLILENTSTVNPDEFDCGDCPIRITQEARNRGILAMMPGMEIENA